ncbi:hypothetical protein EHS25_003477 [Saitozyma podzolica]|uniref:SRP54-type proteins GTP-binding domain-containing protein n=1 Tax=Saitozyma podzolica TaxID=1890683 RepID=A0A427Y7C8_9TREE|nr:hypothetical protein EHS25_003477 [Saitozyma podzolica]
MLDHVSISHQSGLVLWSRSFTPAFASLAASSASPVNALVREALIEGKDADGFERDGYSVRWQLENSLGLVFVVVFPALLPLAYVPELLGRTRQLFVSMFRGVLEDLAAAMRGGDTKPLGLLEERLKVERWDMVFDRCLRDCEGRKDVKVEPEAAPPSAEEIAKNVQALKTRMRQKTASPSPRKSTASTAKLMRKWADSPVSAGDMAALDYSEQGGEIKVDTTGLVSADAMGSRTANGYEVAEWDFKLPSEEEILSRDTQALTVKEEASTWSLFSRLAGRRAVTREDLGPVLGDMEKNLMDKNVAKDIAEKLCEAVGTALVGKKLGVKSEVQSAVSAALTRVLTPKTSTDVLLDIQRKRAASEGPSPYAITFVGVNGVGKSTNLSKVAFWLLQNKLRVLIAACDTFRSGAVEQLRVHVRNLGALGEEMGTSKVELYERGYGKDAAGIAKDALAYENGFDVVLIDTAGRMQDNEPLMRALAKVLFVGEALVGNEAVDQLSKFDRALRDFTGARKRGIDGILLTKFDTIDDKVGAALSMTYVTGQPILFVGCGQTYTDLRQLRVGHIVQALLA